MAPALAIFDLDGTLIDSRGDIADALNAALAERGLPTHPEAAVTGMIGDGVAVLVERALGPAERQRHADVVAGFRQRYAERLVQRTRLYPGIAELLRAAEGRGLALAVATNKPAAFARRILEELEVLACFAAVVGDEPGMPKKPDPACVRRILSETGAAPAATAYVGDSLVDLQTARAAGVKAVAVAWGYTPRAALAAADPDALCDDAAALAALLGLGRLTGTGSSGRS